MSAPPPNKMRPVMNTVMGADCKFVVKCIIESSTKRFNSVMEHTDGWGHKGTMTNFLTYLRCWYRVINRTCFHLWTKCEILVPYRNEEKWLLKQFIIGLEGPGLEGWGIEGWGLEANPWLHHWHRVSWRCPHFFYLNPQFWPRNRYCL